MPSRSDRSFIPLATSAINRLWIAPFPRCIWCKHTVLTMKITRITLVCCNVHCASAIPPFASVTLCDPPFRFTPSSLRVNQSTRQWKASIESMCSYRGGNEGSRRRTDARRLHGHCRSHRSTFTRTTVRPPRRSCQYQGYLGGFFRLKVSAYHWAIGLIRTS